MDSLQILRTTHNVLVATTGAIAGFALSSSDEADRYSRLLQDANTVLEWLSTLDPREFDRHCASLVDKKCCMNSHLNSVLESFHIQAGNDLDLSELVVVNEFKGVDLHNMGAQTGYYLETLDKERQGFIPDDIGAPLVEMLKPYRDRHAILERLSFGNATPDQGRVTKECTAIIRLRDGDHQLPGPPTVKISGRQDAIDGGTVLKWCECGTGEFRNRAPKQGVLRDLMEFSKVPVNELRSEIEGKLREAVAKRKIALFGIEVDASTAGIVLPLALPFTH